MKQDFALWGEEPQARVTFLIDTGARFSLIDRQIVEDMKIERPLRGRDPSRLLGWALQNMAENL